MPKEPRTKKGKFRAQYKTYGLTYSRCPLEREELLKGLQAIPSIQITDYYIARETHKDNELKCPYHLHVWFEVADKPNIRSDRFFDIQGYHPNIGKKKRNWIWNYLKKQDTTPLTNIEDSYVAKAKAGDFEGAITQFSLQHPKEFVINYERIVKNMKAMSKKPRPVKIYPFTGEVIEWDYKKRCLCIVGPARIGKTQWAKSFVHHHLKMTFLRVTHIDGLKQYNGEDCIIYDDVSFAHLPRETQVHIAEVEEARDIHCRNRPASIPSGIFSIFVNNDFPFIHGDASIDDRLHVMSPLIRFY